MGLGLVIGLGEG